MTKTAVRKDLHPARFSKEIITRLRSILEPGVHLHDPFGGSGVRLGKLADEIGCSFSGTELAPAFIIDPRVVHGDATVRGTYPRKRRWWIVTSPVYPNGIADSWKISDASSRTTYRSRQTEILGEDRDFHENNQARYGYRGTKRDGQSQKRQHYWRIARESVLHWSRAERVILNVSDFKHSNGEIEPFTKDWISLMKENGWSLVRHHKVATPRNRKGSKKSQVERMPFESVLVFERAA